MVQYKLSISERAYLTVGGQTDAVELGPKLLELLRMVAERHPEPANRALLAKKLYPESTEAVSRTSLRQLIARLSKVVPAGVLNSSSDALGLDQRVEVEFKSPFIKPSPISSAAQVDPQDPGHHFCNLVLEVAEFDPNEARQMLVSQTLMPRVLSSFQLADLLERTRPKRMDEPFSGEHANLEILVLLLRDCPTSFLLNRIDSVIRLGRRRRQREVVNRAEALKLFVLSDVGIDRQRGPLSNEHLRKLDLYGLQAYGAYLWNIGEREKSADLMLSAERLVEGATPTTALHYWCNLSVIAELPGYADEARRAVANARAHPLAKIDRSTQRCLLNSEAVLAASEGRYGEALRLNHENRVLSEKMGWAANETFRVDSMIFERQGDLRASKQSLKLWHRAMAAGGRGNNTRLVKYIHEFQAKYGN